MGGGGSMHSRLYVTSHIYFKKKVLKAFEVLTWALRSGFRRLSRCRPCPHLFKIAVLRGLETVEPRINAKGRLSDQTIECKN